MTKNQIKAFLRNKRGYLKFGKNALAKQLNIENTDLCAQAIREVKNELNRHAPSITMIPQQSTFNQSSNSNLNVFKNTFNVREYPLTPKDCFIKNNKHGKRVLVIGDLHLPFTLAGYLEHCKKIYKKYNCDTVVFIGDILDLHFTSYHETSTDGYGATEEHDLSVKMIKQWYKAFPKAHVTIGNHDALIYRKAMSAGISKRWIQDFSQVLGTPGWKWVTDVIIDDVLYTHGTTNAYTKAKQNLMSTVQGHLHSQAGIQFYVGAKTRIFGFQVGCGVDMKSYAMEYGRNFPKPVISCGVVINGLDPYLEVMNL